MEPHFEGKEGRGVIDRIIGKCDGGFLYTLPHCNYCAISNHSAAICHLLSATLYSTGVGKFGQNFRVFSLE